jgi:abortive infection bacteriophage resistance protein
MLEIRVRITGTLVDHDFTEVSRVWGGWAKDKLFPLHKGRKILSHFIKRTINHLNETSLITIGIYDDDETENNFEYILHVFQREENKKLFDFIHQENKVDIYKESNISIKELGFRIDRICESIVEQFLKSDK